MWVKELKRKVSFRGVKKGKVKDDLVCLYLFDKFLEIIKFIVKYLFY